MVFLSLILLEAHTGKGRVWDSQNVALLPCCTSGFTYPIATASGNCNFAPLQLCKYSQRCYIGSLDLSCLLKENLMISPVSYFYHCNHNWLRLSPNHWNCHQCSPQNAFSVQVLPLLADRVISWVYLTVGEVLLNNPWAPSCFVCENRIFIACSVRKGIP